MNDRTFGVELEFNIKSKATAGQWGGYGGNDAGHSAAAEALEAAGIKWDDRNEWMGSDGSGIEIRTPILKGQAGMNELKKAMDALKAAGGVCTDYDGMHVHHGAPEFVDNKELMELAATSWLNCRSHILNFVNPKRNNNGACPNGWSASKIENMKKAAPTGRGGRDSLYYACATGGRADFNMTALYEHGTIEFRLHEGTLDSDVAEAWIRFGQRFLTTILKRGTPLTATDAPDLLKKVRCSKTATAKLLERVSGTQELIAKQNKLVSAYAL
jgi:hypothetical protein